MGLRWGILGCGDVARRRVAQAILDDESSELVAACRRDENELAAFCDDFGVVNRYRSDQQLLDDPDIDAIYIATPVRFHHPQTLAAAAAGKHVLVEKPMAMDPSECDEMIAACAKQQRLLGVAYYRRFYPVVARIKQLMNDGVIGEPRSVSALTSNPFSMTEEDQGYWRVLPAEGGGGALMDIGSHRIDLFLDVFGPIDDVRGVCDRLHADYEADNTVSISFRFANGRHGQLQCFFGVSVDPDEFSVIGTRGRLSVSPLNQGLLRIETADGVREESHPPAANFNLPLISNFVAAVLGQEPLRVNGESGRMTNDAIWKAYQSSEA